VTEAGITLESHVILLGTWNSHNSSAPRLNSAVALANQPWHKSPSRQASNPMNQTMSLPKPEDLRPAVPSHFLVQQI
jgi:hypothetical protein